jgi:glutathione S-transferase
MKLYMHPASPNVRAVLMTAELLELPLEKQLVEAMAGEQSTPAYLRVNPNGLFPVLVAIRPTILLSCRVRAQPIASDGWSVDIPRSA